MSSDYITELFKDLHEEELERMDKLLGEVTLPTAILSVLFGVGSYYLQDFPGFSSDCGTLTFHFLCLTFGAFLLRATYCLIRSILRGKVSISADPSDLAEFISELKEYYATIEEDEGEIDRMVEEDLREGLRLQYIECSSKNRARNIVQSNWLYRARLWIALAFVALVLSAIPFYIIQNAKPDTKQVPKIDFPEVQKVQIVQPELE
ncbi:MAG: hypothetical protein HQ567_19990 [Candidatus Nealsonbacteria bacterium]|nr:hypothetical protein [Candidatus Nealsonbacteria bacterium]